MTEEEASWVEQRLKVRNAARVGRQQLTTEAHWALVKLVNIMDRAIDAEYETLHQRELVLTRLTRILCKAAERVKRRLLAEA
jgi:hypothetical protein